MVGASVAALIGGSNASVSGSDHTDVRSQSAVNVVGVDGNLPAGGVAGHVLVHNSEDGLAGGLVVGKDSSRAKETTLLTAVEVELEGVLALELVVGQDTERFHEDDNTGGVVISAGSTCGGRAGGGIIVSGNDDEVSGVSGNLDDDGGLVEGVGKLGDGDGWVDSDEADEGVVEPSTGLGAVGGPVVTVMIVGEGRHPALGLGSGDEVDEGIGLGLLAHGSRVGDGPGLEDILILIGRQGPEDLGILKELVNHSLLQAGKGVSDSGIVLTVISVISTKPISCAAY